jgi:hypothetical protein
MNILATGSAAVVTAAAARDVRGGAGAACAKAGESLRSLRSATLTAVAVPASMKAARAPAKNRLLLRQFLLTN